MPGNDPLYKAPDIAWPTLALFVAALVLWGGTLALVLQHLIPVWLAIGVLAVASFMFFTVLHDGVHRSLMRGYPRMNEVVANISGAILSPLAISDAFRYVHFKHHRHTNESEIDPDMWSGIGYWWTLPLQWMTADIRYAQIVLQDWRDIAPAKRRKILIGVLTTFGLYALSWPLGWGWEATLFWLVPSRLAIGWLAFAFNFLPHHPHTVEQAHNPYASTNIREGGEPLMTGLFLYQNYHLIHHLFPSVPFYRYVSIWRQRRTEFRGLGAPVVGAFDLIGARQGLALATTPLRRSQHHQA